MLSWPYKDPDEVLDYRLDWTERLASDIIVTTVWFQESGDLVIDSEAHTNTTCTIWISGGTDGETYILTNRITTTAGRTMDQSVKLKVKTK